ncbi:carbohydrate ABC transporter permease [Streptomonospora wellingtoniae]|uniref:Carbohydrate ABC transporter permease n=1 Tax=Streptomonospora wellingtoniae TaxID=3075544 RepID=A0ABU2KP06_9ACTN|nr:carbohydrate ABC transporter permease [Streptomonospora sp. DSM 45055]MDT0300898.1 carbohydrate ABC transporter permease [Streptomonospora sp. DSM 45055]
MAGTHGGPADTSDAAAGRASGHRPRRSFPFVPLMGIAWFAAAFYPVYYMFISSLREQGDYLDGSPWLPPLDPVAGNYTEVLSSGLALYFLNSLFVVTLSVGLIVFVSFLAAYVIARISSRAVRGVFTTFLMGLAIPLQAAIIPVYLLIVEMGLYDTLYALIPPQVAFGIPLTVLILVNFIRDIPNDLFDAMKIDGGGHRRTLRTLVLPLSRPALVTVVIYNALQAWNNFLFPLVLTQSANVRTIPLALQQFQGQYGVDVPGLMAAVLLSTLPIVVLYIVARRQLLGGLTAGFGR